MVRLADLPEVERGHHLDRVKQIPSMSPPRMDSGPSLNQRLQLRVIQPLKGWLL